MWHHQQRLDGKVAFVNTKLGAVSRMVWKLAQAISDEWSICYRIYGWWCHDRGDIATAVALILEIAIILDEYPLDSTFLI